MYKFLFCGVKRLERNVYKYTIITGKAMTVFTILSFTTKSDTEV